MHGGCPEAILRVVIYLKCAMVCGGICAVKLCGSDWNASWLGVLPDSGRTWYGCIRRPGNTLECSSNVSRHQLILVIPNNRRVCTSPLSSLNGQILWDQPDIPNSLCNPDKELFDFKRDS
jgi:hypothetical protein